MEEESDLYPCNHCTFLNKPGRVRCSMCQRNIRKRGRSSLSRTSSEVHSTNPELREGVSTDAQKSGSFDSTVPTLFSTAAGHPVSVSESALAAARSRLDQTGSTDEQRSSGSRPVSTLFSTAAGQPVSVSESALAAARSRLDQTDSTDEQRSSGSRPVPTLFSTAAGQPVSVSESALAAARSRIESSNEETSSSSSDACSDSPAALRVADITVGSDSLSAARPVLTGTRRRAFVVPRAVAQPLRPPAGRPSASLCGPRPICFNVFLYTSLSLALPPSCADILNGTFAFRRTSCSAELVELLGLTANGDVVRPAHFRHALLALGAQPSGCSEEWCAQMLCSILLKLRGLSTRTSPSLPVFSLSHALLYLCFKYNREFVGGQRPALRIISEGDIAAASLMVVSVVSILPDERIAPHTCVARISDGSYDLKVTLDVPLTNLTREGVLRPGQKILVCGARMLMRNFCSPLECRDVVVLALQYNCTRPADAAAVLGLYNCPPPVVPASAIHALGGLVPSVRGVVRRILPPFFLEQLQSSSSTATATATTQSRGSSGGPRVVRSLLAQLKHSERAVQSASPGDVPELSDKRLVRVTSLVLSCESPDDMVVQVWEDCSPGAALDESEVDFPQEGSTAVIFAVTPARGRQSHPFQNAKVLHASRRLEYAQLTPPTGRVAPLLRADALDPFTAAGTALDLAGFFVDSMSGSFVVALADKCYALVDVPSATPLREIAVTLPTSSFTPVIVQNASFVRRADDDIGEDCLHLLANEFTRVIQRPAAVALRDIVAGLEKERLLIAKGPAPARVAEILRLRQLNGSGRASAGRLSVDAAPGVPPRASKGQERVPYYLRDGAKSTVPSGVVFPQSKPPQALRAQQAPTVKPVMITASSEQTCGIKNNGVTHIFANIIGLRLIRFITHGGQSHVTNLLIPYGAKSERMALPCNISLDAGTSYFEIDMQYGAVAQECVTGRITKPHVLGSILEQRIGMRRMCALAVDEGCVDHFERRSKQLEILKQSPEDCWWKLLLFSRIDGVGDDEKNLNEECTVPWLEMEWKIFLDMLSDGIRNSLFKLSIGLMNEVSRVVFIRDDCSLCDLMNE